MNIYVIEKILYLGVKFIIIKAENVSLFPSS